MQQHVPYSIGKEYVCRYYGELDREVVQEEVWDDFIGKEIDEPEDYSPRGRIPKAWSYSLEYLMIENAAKVVLFIGIQPPGNKIPCPH